MSTHTHRPTKELARVQCFTYCARPDRCNPAAHGWTTSMDFCRCGAVRQTNCNGRHVERGEWTEASR